MKLNVPKKLNNQKFRRIKKKSKYGKKTKTRQKPLC